MPIRLDGDLPQSAPRQADIVMEKSGKSMKGTELISPGRLKTWGLAFFAVFVVGTVGAFVFILQNNLGNKSSAAVSDAPDLSVLGPISVSGGQMPSGTEFLLGSPAQFAGTVVNQGSSGAREFMNAYEIDLNANGEFAIADVSLPGMPQYMSMRPGMNKQTTAVWNNPPQGVHNVRLCADSSARIDESDEANNCSPATIVTVGGGSPAACVDGQDNDGDGLVDYPQDPGCDSAVDTDEMDALPPPVSDVSICPWQGPGAAIRGKCNDPLGCSFDVYQSDPVNTWGAVRCFNNATPCAAGQNCESPVQSDGLTYAALLTDQNGALVRYNKAGGYSSVAIIHPGGGGAGKWLDDRTDYPGDKTDWSGLQNDYGMRVVGVKWVTTGVECGASECGRWLPKTDAATDFAALAVRPDAVFRWIDGNLNPDNKPLALLGSSGGAHAILSSAMVGSPLMEKVKYMGVVSLAPLTDYYYACTEYTPAGMYIDQATGAYSANPGNAGAALNKESGGLEPKGLPDDVWNIQQGQPGCRNQFNLSKPVPPQPSPRIAALTDPSGVSNILDSRMQSGDPGYASAADFIVNTAGGSDDTCGCTWAEGRIFNHAYFANAKRTWRECTALTHGGALSQPDKQCFDWIYQGLVGNLINQ